MDTAWKNVNKLIDDRTKMYGDFQLGKYSKNHIFSDMKHFVFSMSRYKFISKLMMYEDSCRVLELGCNEALGALILEQNTNLRLYTGVDFDEDSIEWDKKYLAHDTFEFVYSDFFELHSKLNTNNKYNLVYSLDVIEHLNPESENDFLNIICRYLSKDGLVVIGTPNITMTPYASEGSKIGHINLYDQKRLHGLCKRYFNNVIILGMNDEIVNTGFEPMTSYIFAVCSGSKRQ